MYLADFRFSILLFPATLGSLIGCSGAVVASGESTGDAAHDARAKAPAEAGPDGGDYDYIDGSLAACSPACDKTQVCITRSAADVGCLPDAAPDSSLCLPGCPCAGPVLPSCHSIPECKGGATCACILQGLCGGPGDASFQSNGVASCDHTPSGAWLIQCDNGA
jgi:hypothetical protein